MGAHTGASMRLPTNHHYTAPAVFLLLFSPSLTPMLVACSTEARLLFRFFHHLTSCFVSYFLLDALFSFRSSFLSARGCCCSFFAIIRSARCGRHMWLCVNVSALVKRECWCLSARPTSFLLSTAAISIHLCVCVYQRGKVTVSLCHLSFFHL